MDLLSLLRLIGRHWRVTAPAALLTLLGVVAVLKVSAPTYNATGSMVLLNPRSVPDAGARPTPPEVGQNPFARYGDIAIVTDILTRIMSSDSKRDELASQGVTGYDIVANSFQHDPVFEVTGRGPDAEAAMRSTDIVLTEAETVLTELQRDQGADPDYLISSAPLEAPSTASAMYGSTMRAAIGALAVGGLGTLGLAVLAEVRSQRRPGRRTAFRPGAAVSNDAGGSIRSAGSNGSAAEGAAGSEAGSDASALEGSAGSTGAGEGVGSAGSNGSVVEGSAASEAHAGGGEARPNGMFNSAGIVPDGPPRRAEAGVSDGSPTRGRAGAPLGRRPHRRSAPPDASDGYPVDDSDDSPTSDR